VNTGFGTAFLCLSANIESKDGKEMFIFPGDNFKKDSFVIEIASRKPS